MNKQQRVNHLFLFTPAGGLGQGLGFGENDFGVTTGSVAPAQLCSRGA